MSARERGLCNSPLYFKMGKFCALHICYSNGSNPYLTGLAPVIPPPELQGEDQTGMITAIPLPDKVREDRTSSGSPASAEYIKPVRERGEQQQRYGAVP